MPVWRLSHSVDERATGGIHNGVAVAVDHLSANGDCFTRPDDGGDDKGNGSDALLTATIAPPLTSTAAKIKNKFDSNGEGEEGIENGVAGVHFLKSVWVWIKRGCRACDVQ